MRNVSTPVLQSHKGNILNNRVLERILQIMEQELLDLTRDSVARGNKIFGAAIIDRQSLELVVAGTTPRPGKLSVCFEPRTLFAVPVGNHLEWLRQLLLPVHVPGFTRQLRDTA